MTMAILREVVVMLRESLGQGFGSNCLNPALLIGIPRRVAQVTQVSVHTMYSKPVQ